MIRILLSILVLVSCSHRAHKKEISESGIPLAVVNLKIEGDATVKELISSMEIFVKKAKSKNAEIILFPELVTLDLLDKNPNDEKMPEILTNLTTFQNEYERGLSRLAKANDIMIVGANHYVMRADRKVLNKVNRAYIVRPDGKLEHQDKIFPTPWEVKQGVKGGNKGIKKFQNEKFTFIVLTCHDAEFPNLSHKIAKLKPEVIFVPSMTDDLNGLRRVKRTSQARAVEQMSYVAMTGASSLRGAKWHTYQGRNFLFTPQNKYFSEPSASSLEESMSLFYIDIPRLRKARADKSQVYPVRDYLNLGN